MLWSGTDIDRLLRDLECGFDDACAVRVALGRTFSPTSHTSCLISARAPYLVSPNKTTEICRWLKIRRRKQQERVTSLSNCNTYVLTAHWKWITCFEHCSTFVILQVADAQRYACAVSEISSKVVINEQWKNDMDSCCCGTELRTALFDFLSFRISAACLIIL